MKELRFLPTTIATIDGSSKSWINQEIQQMRRIFNITTATPISIVSEISRCLRCAKSIILAIRAALVSGNHFERFVNICERLRGMLRCTSHVPGKCSKDPGIESLLNNLKYFCVEKFSVYKYIFECLDLNAVEAFHNCQEKCKTTQKIVAMFLHGYIHSSLLFTVPILPDMPRKINVGRFNKLSSDICNIISCQLQCLRQEYNQRCDEIGGEMLLEVLLKPLVSLYKSWAYSPVATSMFLIMPKECDFATMLDELDNKKIDEVTKEIDRTLLKYGTNQYHPQGLNLSTLSRMPVFKTISSSLNKEKFLNNPIQNSEPSIHIEEIEKAIKEFKEIDRLQRMQL
ncbi:BMA-CPG-4 [Dirofilaria immitis]|nr:BMA-CPG-4 [Dirofilaria immitis]